jgi:hypothetical protein
MFCQGCGNKGADMYVEAGCPLCIVCMEVFERGRQSMDKSQCKDCKELAPVCRNCKWWKPVDEEGTGECIRHAPRPVINPKKSRKQDAVNLITYWPETFSFETCGEWERSDWPDSDC